MEVDSPIEQKTDPGSSILAYFHFVSYCIVLRYICCILLYSLCWGLLYSVVFVVLCFTLCVLTCYISFCCSALCIVFYGIFLFF